MPALPDEKFHPNNDAPPIHDASCTVMGQPDGTIECMSYHCGYCGGGCSMMGHEECRLRAAEADRG